MAAEPLVVQALFAFKGSNNDELCFHKGDLITVTQKEDGGWWEGTLGEKTGWFPSNYVREVKDVKVISMNHDAANISIVYQDLVESERAHVAEQQGLVTNFLSPLERSTILSTDEYKQLIGNFMEVLDTHKELLKLIEDDYQKQHKDQRIGRHFINHAHKMKNVHQAYCSLHPKAVCILDKYKDDLSKYMESCGANTPGLLVLTTGLSKPFRRLAKYSGMLLEVERHVESSHPDRGDIQRSVTVYKDIDATCAATRRQKELETQVLTGPVRGWEGQSLSTLGDIIYMGSVAVGPQHLDRYLVLFPSTLLILSISHRLSAFIYEGKLPVTGITVTRLEDNEHYKNGFEITGPMIEKVTAVCQSKDEASHWVEILRKYNPNCTIPSGNQKALPSQVEIVPQPPPHLNQRGYCTRASVLIYTPEYVYTPTLPSQYYPPAAPYAALTKLYHGLVKQKVITKDLLKKLLYPEFAKKIDTSEVPRRQHKSECFLMKTGSDYSSDDDSSSSDSDSSDADEVPRSSKICRQDAFDDNSDDSEDSSNPFGYIRYYNPQTGSQTTDSERFSGVSNSRTKVAQPRESKKPSVVLTSSVRLEFSNHPSETSNHPSETSSHPSETSGHPSEMSSRPSEVANSISEAANHYSVDSNNTSTASKHSSVASNNPSVPIRPSQVSNRRSGASVVSNISIYVSDSADKPGSIVGTVSDKNVVRKSSTKLIQLVASNSSLSRPKLSPKISEDSDISSYVTPNFACENLANLNGSFEINTNDLFVADSYQPITRQSCPNKLVADRFNESSLTTLYIPPYQSSSDNNLAWRMKEVLSTTSNSSCSTTTHSSSLDLPINMIPLPDPILAELLYNFDDEDVIKPPSMFVLDEESSGAKKKALPLTSSSVGFRKHSLNSDKIYKRRSSIQMSSDLLEDGYRMLYKHCKYHVDPSNTPRSSDSGMAGSCTLNSPEFPHHSCTDDIPERNAVSLMEPDAYESQCRCTSPFGSTPRTSANVVVDSVRTSFSSSELPPTSVRTSFSSSELPPVPSPWQSVTQIHSKISDLRVHTTAIQQSKSMSALVEAPALQEKSEIYRSGLYAHWWMKAKIPAGVMSALIATTPNNNNRSGGTISNVRTVTPPSHGTLNNNRRWTVCCLRPAAPIRPGHALASAQNGSPVRINRKPAYSKDDALILEVIEAYFSSVKTRSTVNSVNQIAQSEPPHENTNELVRTLVGTVRNIECNMGLLTTQLTEERAARCALQTIIKKHLSASCKDMDGIDWPTMESNILS